jgi:SAM-dependent methyltransferase
LIETTPKLTEFRLQPDTCLRRLRYTFLHAGDVLPAPASIVWCCENFENRGLDDFEVEAVLAPWVEVEWLEQVERGSVRSRTLAVGKLREDLLGLALHLGTLAGPTYLASSNQLEMLPLVAPRSVLLFVDREQAVHFHGNPHTLMAARLRRLLRARKLMLGLWVPAHRTAQALEDLRAELAPLRAFQERPGPLSVRFEDTSLLTPLDRLDLAMRQAGADWDCSLTAPLPPEDESADRKRPRPYLRAGAYQPQPFDFRVPAGAWDPGGWVEMVSVVLTRFGGDWGKFRAWRLTYDPALLARLLDFRRMERYFRELPGTPGLSQRYDEYRVYNWPAPDRSPRCTLVDCGSLDDPWLAIHTLDEAHRMARGYGSRWQVCDADELFRQGRREAQQGVLASAEAVLSAQRKAHGYLKTIPPAGPLRQELAAFVDGLPEQLGDVLELGSGYGQLARALEPRARSYCCVDLDPDMFQALGEDMRRLAVVADIHALPFADGSFDTVLANNVLEHTYDPLLCLREVRRVLRPGGRLHALIPLDAFNPAHAIRTHLWKADAEGICAAARRAGLVPVRWGALDLYALGVEGSFPTCRGLVCDLEARRPESARKKNLSV